MKAPSGARRSGLILIGSVIVVLGIVGAFAFRSLDRSHASAAWVLHTHNVIDKLQDSLLAMERIQSNSRKFALTGDESHLDPYLVGKEEARRNIKAVRILTTDNPEQQK